MNVVNQHISFRLIMYYLQNTQNMASHQLNIVCTITFIQAYLMMVGTSKQIGYAFIF